MTDKNGVLLSDKISRGLEKAYEKLVEFKRYKKSPLIVSRNGKIVAIPPDEIPPTTRYVKSNGKKEL